MKEKENSINRIVYVDVHCHLDICGDLNGVLARAKEAGVGIIVTNGTNPEINKKILDISARNNDVKPALGIYPIDALKITDEKINSEIDFIRKNSSRISAIGEVGLDYQEDSENHLRQKEIFKKFINLSIELDLPIMVHSRKAEKEAVEILEETKSKKVIMHCFSGNFSLVKKIDDNNWYFSIPTSIKHSQHFQMIVKKIPIERLLCETDSPFLHPDKLRNNEPALVIESYKKIAEIKNLNLEEVKNSIFENYQKLFTK